jgi:hypothetical protein
MTVSENEQKPAWKEGYNDGCAGRRFRPKRWMDRALYSEGYDEGVLKKAELEGKVLPAYPAPPGGPEQYSQDWLNGWRAEFDGAIAYLGEIRKLDEFNAGAKAAQQWKLEHGEAINLGIITTDGLTEADPKNPTLSDLLEDAKRHGYEEARDLMPFDPRHDYSISERMKYKEGYNKGIQEKVAEAAISPNRARELFGINEAKLQFDPVKIPGHYNYGKIEVTNFISDQQLDFPKGNVIKYVARAGKKDPATEIQDLEKAAAYLQMAHNIANGKPAVVRDPVTNEVVWSLFRN